MSRCLGVILSAVHQAAAAATSAAPVLDMFTLCMSRGHPPLHDVLYTNSVAKKQIKGGYLLRYRRGLFCKSWNEEWFVLYDDSTLAWYADKGLSRPRGRIRISDAPDLLAVGEWTRQVPKRPRFPRACHVGQLIALGSRIPHDVHWLMAQSPAEVNDWMTAISNTLPPPPHLPLENKPLPLTPKREICPSNHPPLLASGGECCCGSGGGSGLRNHQLNGGCCQGTGGTGGEERGGGAGTAACCSAVAAAAVSAKVSSSYDADHTVLSGVVIDWGHGWGWGQGAWAAQSACAAEAAVSSALYCHALGDYSVSGFDEVDWSAFGDFSF